MNSFPETLIYFNAKRMNDKPIKSLCITKIKIQQIRAF